MKDKEIKRLMDEHPNDADLGDAVRTSMRRPRRFYIWLRRAGLLCRKYELRYPKKPRVKSTIYPDREYNFNEISENIYEQTRDNEGQ